MRTRKHNGKAEHTDDLSFMRRMACMRPIISSSRSDCPKRAVPHTGPVSETVDLAPLINTTDIISASRVQKSGRNRATAVMPQRWLRTVTSLFEAAQEKSGL